MAAPRWLREVHRWLPDAPRGGPVRLPVVRESGCACCWLWWAAASLDATWCGVASEMSARGLDVGCQGAMVTMDVHARAGEVPTGEFRHGHSPTPLDDFSNFGADSD